MTERPSYIHIEGMDLAGKTSTARLFVARRPDPWEIKRNSLSEESRLRDIADEMLDTGDYSSETIGTVYAAALMADLDRFKRPEVNTVQESTILLRSIAFHAINGNERALGLFESMVDLHPQFDASFMLTASHEERLRRLDEKPDASNHDRLITRDPVKFFAMESLITELAKRRFNAHVIDTSETPIESVVKAIEDVVDVQQGQTVEGEN